MLRRQLRGMFVEFLGHAKSIGALRRADPIIAENSDVDTGFILFPEQAIPDRKSTSAISDGANFGAQGERDNR